MITEKDIQTYKDFMHYGKIIKVEDFDSNDDRSFVTVKIFELDGIRRIFIIRNGLLIHTEKF